jgi:hypothetical protein
VSGLKVKCGERHIMKNMYKITQNEKSAELHLKLKGDFDGNSAFELMESLKSNCRLVSTAYIHTNELKHIYPFGAAVWQSHCGELRHCTHMHLQFVGDHAQELATALDQTQWVKITPSNIKGHKNH